MIIKRVTLEEFNLVAEGVHALAFNEIRPRSANTYDFALLCEDDDGTPLGYMACIEIDAEKIWVVHGAAFPSAKGHIKAAKGFHLLTNYLREHYTEAKLDSLNTNLPMIKLAYSAGFLIVGTEVQGPDIYVTMRAGF